MPYAHLMHQDQGNGWTATGLRWQDGAPHLTATDGRERHTRPLADGAPVAWRITGPRRCTGAHTERGHRPCPHRATVPSEGALSQCPSCQNADRGLQLARDRILDDGRTYRLYLAWFAPGLLKVGLTAADRGTARLLEQAALTWTFVAHGPLPAVRRAELALAHARLARERIPAAAKYPAWWSLPAPAERRDALTAARTRAHHLLAEHDQLTLLTDHPVTDQVALFGLTDGAPEHYQQVKSLTDGAHLSGRLRRPIGSHLFLDRPDGPPLLLDTRLLTGWTLHPAPDAPGCDGLALLPRTRPAAEQDTLF
ncbi:hypothetical protein Kpho02_41820 [Kitasatospora phosalacinea]|uniref:DUF2797 domain-containing protein n=2 Tax=Kitasatospora phosalacinea TaxID=2065 RepID=A0A9W6V349_9ACTN|nr:hypothetical protein Kpho02_41820 [Kitasatospora phosalacinea]